MIAEGNQVAVEVASFEKHVNGKTYTNKFHFLITIEEGKMVDVQEYMAPHLFQFIQPQRSLSEVAHRGAPGPADRSQPVSVATGDRRGRARRRAAVAPSFVLKLLSSPPAGKSDAKSRLILRFSHQSHHFCIPGSD
jgi:hypothetical protein